MTENVIYDCLLDVYAIFGKKEPSRTSSVVRVLVEDKDVQEIPDGIRDYIVSRFKQLDNMPANLIKAFIGAWNTYQMENPNMMLRETCPVCGGNGGWEAWKPGDDGIPQHFFAFCPKCGPKKADRVWPHARALQQKGCLVMPSGYQGGRLKFEADHGLSPMGTGKVSMNFQELRKRAGFRQVKKAASEEG